MTQAPRPSPPDANESRQGHPNVKSGTPACPLLVPRHSPTAGPPVWPTVIGVLSIVAAGLAILQYYWLSDTIDLPDTPGLSEFARLHGDEWIVLVGFSLFRLGWLLLVPAGILTILRRPWAGRLHLFLGVFLTVASILVVTRTTDSVLSGRSFFQASGTGAALADALPILLWAAYAVFITAWFLRASVRRRVRSWRDPTVRRAERAGIPPGAIWPRVIGAAAILVGVWNTVARVPWLFPWGPPDAETATLIVTAMTWPVLASVGGWLLLGLKRTAMPVLLACAAAAIFFVAFLTALRSNMPVLSWYDLYRRVYLRAPDLAFAAFLLIWFLRPAIREQVRAWRPAG